MWCLHCQQEVPVQGSLRLTGGRCPRCERLLQTGSEPIGSVEVSPPPAEQLGNSDAIQHSLRLAKAKLAAGEGARTLRFDMAQHGVSPALSGTKPQRPLPGRPTVSPNKHQPPRGGQTFAWIMAAAGAMILGLGIGLLGRSVWADEPELWNAAVAATLAGQGLLIIGLLQLVAVLWSAGRGAAQRLGQMHEELRALRRALDTASGRHSASAAQFYADLAQDAGPDILLGNLRGQLDALSSRLRK